ncbi:MAG: AAA family ATPase [Planctomycetota bacterium]|nr:AAA family ATPase [Planctomycetota bacterium]
MSPSQPDDPTGPLRDALQFSPENVPLRLHLAKTLMGLNRFDEAVEEFQTASKLEPANDTLRLDLGDCYLAQGKVQHAGVLADLLIARAEPAGMAFLLLARVRSAEGAFQDAHAAFLRAVDVDPTCGTHEWAKALGFSAPTQEEEEEQPQRLAAGHGGRDPGDTENLLGDSDFERPKIDFDHVGGMQTVKDEISLRVIQPLAHPEMFAAYGKSVGGGVLLYGPPGCGKTHIARATAGQAKAQFLSVGIHDVLDMWIGNSEKNLHAIFEEARRRAPCVLFFDEVDALGAKRSDMSGSAGRTAVNQFLAELDGVQAQNEGVLVLAATNAPWQLDSAFRRPGRFDRLIFVPPPDANARVEILRVLLEGKPCETLDLDKVARKTDKLSGADLMGMIDVAVDGILREALKTGKPRPLTTKDLLKASKGFSPSTSEWFATAKNHILFANQGGTYDEVARYMGLN